MASYADREERVTSQRTSAEDARDQVTEVEFLPHCYNSFIASHSRVKKGGLLYTSSAVFPSQTACFQYSIKTVTFCFFKVGD